MMVEHSKSKRGEAPPCIYIYLVVVEDVPDLLEAVLDLAREGVLAQQGETRRGAGRGQHESAAAAKAPRALRRPRGAPAFKDSGYRVRQVVVT